MRFSTLILMFLILSACSTFKDMTALEVPRAKLSLDEEEYLRKAEEFYNQDYFEECLNKLDKFLIKYPTSVIMGDIFFLRGKAFLKLNEIPAAEEALKQSYEIWQNSEKGRAKALYYLSIVNERGSRDSKLIANLVKLENGKPVLDSRVYDFDIPAKLAAAYAREGNLELSKKYSHKMDQYLKTRVPYSELDSELVEQVSQSLYEVAVNPLFRIKEDLDFEKNMQGIEAVQSYLLRTIELNRTPWAEKALYEYVHFYDTWIEKEALYFDELYKREDIVGARRLQQMSRNRFEQLQRSIQKIEESELPLGSMKNDNLVKYHAVKLYLIDKIAGYLIRPDVGSGLTKEAQELLQPPKNYRLYTPAEVYSELRPKVEIKSKDPNL